MTAQSVSGEIAIWVDGVLSSALPLPDRGLDFGDGLFETLLLRGGKPLFEDLHLRRLRRGLLALHFPGNLEQVRASIQSAGHLTQDREWPWAALRITVTRGGGPRGYAPPADARPRVIATASRLDGDRAAMLPPASLIQSSIRWATQPVLAGLKHLSRLEQVLAAREYTLAGADEALVLDQSGLLVSVTAGNLFLVRGEQLLTPTLGGCGIAGTRRELVMGHWAPALGLEVREMAITASVLAQADEVFYSNSLVGLRPVGRAGELSWRAHPVCGALHRQYRETIA